MTDSIDERLINIELMLTEQQRMLDDLNEVIINQGKEIDALKKENALLKTLLERETVKPLSEETPPPHY
ncbi:MAG TPA: slyX family protein [Alphaproteobacteria bacterium]|nr:slyX family protein [Alphaproteobacteria bacterium]